MVSNSKSYYWYTSPVNGKVYQIANFNKAKKAVKEEKIHIRLWKYEPGKGSHVVFETEKPKISK